MTDSREPASLPALHRLLVNSERLLQHTLAAGIEGKGTQIAAAREELVRVEAALQAAREVVPQVRHTGICDELFWRKEGGEAVERGEPLEGIKDRYCSCARGRLREALKELGL